MAIKVGTNVNGPIGMTKIGDFSLASATTLRIDNIPQNFTHLRVVAKLNSTRAAFANTGCRMIFNTVVASYAFKVWGGATTSGQASAYLGQIPAGTKTNDNYLSNVIIDIPYYANTTSLKSAFAYNSGHDGASTISDQVSNVNGPMGAITRLDIFDDVLSNLGPNASATLYGISDIGIAGSGVPTVTSLPTAPLDGQEVYYVADAANGIVWHLKYRSASASAYKWEYVGGSQLISEILAVESTTSTTYVALTTAGPSIVIPLAGDYDVTVEALTTGSAATVMSYDIGGTGAVDADGAGGGESATLYNNVSRTRRKTAIPAATTLTSKYRSVSAGTAFFQRRVLRAVPVRVG